MNHKTVIVDSVDKVPAGWIRAVHAGRAVEEKFGKRIARLVSHNICIGAQKGHFPSFKVATTRAQAATVGAVYVSPESAAEVTAAVLARNCPTPAPEPVLAPVPTYAIDDTTGQVMSLTAAEAPAAPPSGTVSASHVAAAFGALMEKIERLETQLAELQSRPSTSVSVAISADDLAAALDLAVEQAGRKAKPRVTQGATPALVYNGRA